MNPGELSSHKPCHKLCRSPKTANKLPANPPPPPPAAPSHGVNFPKQTALGGGNEGTGGKHRAVPRGSALTPGLRQPEAGIAGSPLDPFWILGPRRADTARSGTRRPGPARPSRSSSRRCPGPEGSTKAFPPHPAPPARHVPDRGAGGAVRRGSFRRGGDAVTVTGARREAKAASPGGGGAASLPAPSPAAPGRARPALGTSRLPHGPAPAPAALPGGSGHAAAGRAASIRERARGGAGAEWAVPSRAGLGRADRGRAEPCRTEQGRAEPRRGCGCALPRPTAAHRAHTRSLPRAHGTDGSGVSPLRALRTSPGRLLRKEPFLPRALVEFPVPCRGSVLYCRSRRMERLS